MKLLAPAAKDELTERSYWFKKPLARKLASKFKVEFGFEMKGDLEGLKSALPLFWGVHLENNLATNWYYHPEDRTEMLHEATKVAKLKPNYAVLHGIHLERQPPRHDYIGRYINHSLPAEHFKLYKANIDLINTLKHYYHLKIENYPLTDLYFEDGNFLPYTYLYTGIGRLNDLIKVTKETNTEVLLDIEHLIQTLNLLNREKNYHNLPIEKIEEFNLADRKVYELFGFHLKKGYIPYFEKKIEFKDFVKKARSKYFHLTGSTQDVDPGKKIWTHNPIEVGDKVFRKHLKIVLAQKPEVLVVEVASKSKSFNYLRENETEISFDNVCKILLEEL